MEGLGSWISSVFTGGESAAEAEERREREKAAELEKAQKEAMRRQLQEDRAQQMREKQARYSGRKTSYRRNESRGGVTVVYMAEILDRVIKVMIERERKTITALYNELDVEEKVRDAFWPMESQQYNDDVLEAHLAESAKYEPIVALRDKISAVRSEISQQWAFLNVSEEEQRNELPQFFQFHYRHFTEESLAEHESYLEKIEPHVVAKRAVEDLRGQINALWAQLRFPEKKRRSELPAFFENGFRTFNDDLVQRHTSYLEDLSSRDGLVILQKIERKREAIEHLWDQLRATEDERKAFAAFSEDDFTQEKLEEHSQYLESLQELMSMKNRVEAVLVQLRALQYDTHYSRAELSMFHGSVVASQLEELTTIMEGNAYKGNLRKASSRYSETQLDDLRSEIKRLEKEIERLDPIFSAIREKEELVDAKEKMEDDDDAILSLNKRLKEMLKDYEESAGRDLLWRGQAYRHVLAAERRAEMEKVRGH